MNSKENLYRKQEKLFKVMFLALCLTLGVFYYQTFFKSEASLSTKKADCNSPATVCMLTPGQGRTVDKLVPALCCQNRK